MEPEIDYQSIPGNFAGCFNGQCLCADKCLRHLLTACIPEDRNYVTTVNPGKAVPDGKSCPFFLPKKVVRLAVGMLHLYDNLNYRDALAVRREIYLHFGRGTYYRIRNGERLIAPDEQNFIKQVFRKHGITSDPVFDGYEDAYEW